MTRILSALLALVLCAAAAAGDSIEVIELRHRPAAELIPVVKPMLDSGGSITGQGFQLIVRSNPGNLEQIRHLVRTLDSAPAQLLISVFQGSDRELRALDLDASAHYQGERAGANLGDGSGHPGPGADVRYSSNGASVGAQALTTRSRLSDSPIHQLRVSAGTAGYIETGQSIPFFSGRVWQGPRGTAVEAGISYRDVTTGFYVLPRLHGEQVTLDISPHKDALSRGHGGAVDTQRASTTVSGPLGQWLPVGGVTEQVTRSDSGIASIATTTSRNNASIWIKAETLP